MSSEGRISACKDVSWAEAVLTDMFVQHLCAFFLLLMSQRWEMSFCQMFIYLCSSSFLFSLMAQGEFDAATAIKLPDGRLLFAFQKGGETTTFSLVFNLFMSAESHLNVFEPPVVFLLRFFLTLLRFTSLHLTALLSWCSVCHVVSCAP